MSCEPVIEGFSDFMYTSIRTHMCVFAKGPCVFVRTNVKKFRTPHFKDSSYVFIKFSLCPLLCRHYGKNKTKKKKNLPLH